MSDVFTDQREFAEPKRSGMPAWGLSVVIHAFAVLALGLLVKRVVQPPGDEAGRRVAIVLAEETGGDNSLEFIDGDGEADSDSEQSPAAGGEVSTEEAMLPKGDSDPTSQLFPDIALPGGSLVGGGNDELLKNPNLTVSPSNRILPGQGEAEFLAAEARRRAQGPRGLVEAGPRPSPQAR